MKLLHTQIIVEAVEKITKTESGILLTKAVDSVVKKSIVLAVGEGQYESGVFIKPELKVGDIAVYTKYANALDIEFEGKKAVVLQYREIIGYERNETT